MFGVVKAGFVRTRHSIPAPELLRHFVSNLLPLFARPTYASCSSYPECDHRARHTLVVPWAQRAGNALLIEVKLLKVRHTILFAIS